MIRVSRAILTVSAILGCSLLTSVRADDAARAHVGAKADRAPRKVVVGTAIYGPYGTYPGIDERMKELSGIVDQMAGQAKSQFPGRGLDLAILPETSATPTIGPAQDRAIPLKGKIQDTFRALARKHQCYIVLAMDMLEEGPKGPFYSNAAVLFDRQGEVAGIYRKAHPVAVAGTDRARDRGSPRGRTIPSSIAISASSGVQICWDIQFAEGWDALGRAGAEIVAWPTASPATVLPATRPMRTATMSFPAPGATTPRSMSRPEWSPRGSCRPSASWSTRSTSVSPSRLVQLPARWRSSRREVRRQGRLSLFDP